MESVRATWLKIASNGITCAFPNPPYDQVPKKVKTCVYPDVQWEYYPVKVVEYAGQFSCNNASFFAMNVNF